MVTLITKVAVVMINMLTKIRITITITEKKTIMTTRSHSSDFQDTYNNQINFNIDFPLMGLIPHISMAIMSAFPGTIPLIKKSD